MEELVINSQSPVIRFPEPPSKEDFILAIKYNLAEQCLNKKISVNTKLPNSNSALYTVIAGGQEEFAIKLACAKWDYCMNYKSSVDGQDMRWCAIRIWAVII